MNHYNGSDRSNGTRKYASRRASLNKLYAGSIAFKPTVIQLVSLFVMWAVGMMLIYLYTDVFQTDLSTSRILYYLLIIGSTTVLIMVILAFFRRKR